MDFPTTVIKYANNNIQKQVWHKNGTNNVLHREGNKPAYIEYNPNGSLLSRVWAINDRLHREIGPAIEVYDEKGQIIKKEWLINNKYHRIDGPAILVRKNNMWRSCWYFNGHMVVDYNKRICNIRVLRRYFIKFLETNIGLLVPQDIFYEICGYL